MAPAFVSFSRNSQIIRASGTRSDNPNPRKRRNDSRSLIRNSARSSERLFVVLRTRILNIITGSNGGRPPCVPSEEVSAAFSSGRNASNSTAASNASCWSRRSLNRFNRASTSKNPACLRIESSPIHPSQWNRIDGELARFLDASSWRYVTFTREPVARTVSTYYQVRHSAVPQASEDTLRPLAHDDAIASRWRNASATAA